MKVYNTGDEQSQPSLVMLVYGHGGVGKTTFAATAPNPIIADCENGAKYFGLRGIKTDVAQIVKWEDMKEYIAVLEDYETAVIDPVGELMEHLMRYMRSRGDKKLVQNDGTPTMAGWGWLKKTLRDYLKVLRSSGKHVLITAHINEDKDEDHYIKRPLLATKLSEELVNMVDVVGYMTTVKTEDGEDDKRIILVDPYSDRYIAKDRTGQLGKVIEPDFSKIIRACAGTKKYSWSKEPEKEEKKAEEKKEEPTDEDEKKKEIEKAQKKLKKTKKGGDKKDAKKNKR